MRHNAIYQKRVLYAVAFLIIVMIICGVIYIRLNSYSHYVSTTDPSKISYLQSKDSQSHHFEYQFTFRSGCHNCESVKSTVVPLLKATRHHHSPLLVLNANNKSLKHYLMQTGQTDDPTVRILYHGNLLYQYSGTNKHIIKELFHHINPDTHRAFTKHKPRISVIRSMYDGQYSKEPVVNTFNQ